MPHLVPATQGAADAQRRDYAMELKELIESRRHEDGHEEKVSHYPMYILLQPEVLRAASRIAFHSQAECRTALVEVNSMATPRVRTPRGVT